VKQPVRIFINGFGRIGRSAARIILDDPRLRLVGINDLYEAKMMAYLLRHDTLYGTSSHRIAHAAAHLIVDGEAIPTTAQPDPTRLDLYDLDVDVVLQCSGVFLDMASNRPYLEAGAKRVVVSTPPRDAMPVYIRGINDADYRGEPILSNSSCSANAIVPLLRVVEQIASLRGVQMHMYHSYTAYQNLLDGPHYGRDIRRTRAAAANIIPIDSTAADATAYFFPHLAGNLYAKSIRIPVPATTLYDLVIKLEGTHTLEAVRRGIVEAIHQHWQGILAATDTPNVSSDYIGDPHSATVDLPLMDLAGGNLLRLSAWQDNEYGYAARLVEMALAVCDTAR
jgi:glyceraldehyde 3-phosphate dehydrogenase